MTQEHIVKAYDEELDNLKQLIAQMGGRVETLLAESMDVLVQLDMSRADDVIKADKAIDALELTIDQKATELVALRQPMAADLRFIIASLKVSNDLERMGDYAKNIAKRTKTMLKVPLLSTVARSLERLSRLVEDMIRDVLDAWVQGDVDKAVAVIHADREVDQLHTSLFREILTYMMEDPHHITACTHFLFIAKNIERIGDHATNIAEQIYFVATGDQFEEEHANLDKSSSVIVTAPEDN